MTKEVHRQHTDRESLLKGEEWKRLYNPLVMDVFIDYTRTGGHLFAVTGDLDNLGIYVARRGRPDAENLVDFYNQTIRNYLDRWAHTREDTLNSLAFVPSGEEVFIVGVATTPATPIELFDTIRSGIMNLTGLQSYVDVGNTATSFGGTILGPEYDEAVRDVAQRVEVGEGDETVYPRYLQLMKRIRTDLSVALDLEKFSDILEGNYPVELRQLVLTQMLGYKASTKELLVKLPNMPTEVREEIFAILGGGAYGIEVGVEEKIETLLKNLR